MGCRQGFPGDYPGRSHALRMLDVFEQIKNKPDALVEAVLVLAENDIKSQATWERAHEDYSSSPVRDVIWNVLYPDMPWFDQVDTMELAMMRQRVYDIVDAVTPYLKESR